MLQESYPDNPDTIILKNQFYPGGLTEEDIYKYYISIKDKLLNQINRRDIMIFFAADLNKIIVKRKQPDGRFYKLSKSNYDNLITGRTISIHSTMNKREDFGIIDIFGRDSSSKLVAVEVKKQQAVLADAHQLKRYIDYFKKQGQEVRGVLVAAVFPSRVTK